MAYGLRLGKEELPGSVSPIHALYQKLSCFPSAVYASVGAGFAACGIAKCLPLYTEWCQPDLRRHQRVRYSRQYILHHDGTAVVSVTPVGVAAEIRDQLLMRMSPSGKHKAIFTYHLEKEQKQEVLEVWSNIGRVRDINLTALDKHGKVYTDEQFGCFSWSSSEGQILYVAERRRSKTQTLSPQDRSPKGEKPNEAGMVSHHALFQEEKFVYYDNWGEALGDQSVPVLCVLNIEMGEVSILEGIPGHISPGQALWSPDDKGVVFVGWWHEPFRLGLSACSNRRSALFHLDLSERSCGTGAFVSAGKCLGVEQPIKKFIFTRKRRVRSHKSKAERRAIKRSWKEKKTEQQGVGNSRGWGGGEMKQPEQLSSDYQAVSSPRLSPDGRHLIYLEGPVFGPHRQCLKLQMLNWQTKHASTVVDVVQIPTTGFFGIYSGALPLLCWTLDNNRIILNTPQKSRKELLVVDTHLGSVKSITAEMPEGSWTVLGIHQDLLVVSCSSPNCPPSLKVAVLPPAGRELELQWVSVEEASVVPDVEWKILTVHPPVSEEGISVTDQAFEALLLSPPRSNQREKIFPLIVSPHGGPHAVFDACWRPAMACFCQLGFAVLLVNYRGSLGFGQASIDSLISHVGIQDVEDTQLTVELALQMEPLDPNRIALLGGSHGGFICCHLVGKYPERYKVCAVRSPVINMATLLGTSDIPDWRFSALGLPYGFERIPAAEDLAAMLLRSPIAHAAKVQAPVLLCVGARDRRVSPYQAVEYYRVLQARGVPVRLLWYPEERHAINGVEAEADFFMNCAQWIIHYLSMEAGVEVQHPVENPED